MEAVKTRLATFFGSLATQLRHLYHVPPLQIAILASSAVVAANFHAIYNDYSEWYALGPSGAPRNLYGYAMQALLRPFAYHDTTTLAPYLDTQAISRYRRAATTYHLRDLPRRAGCAPPVAPYIVPHRQTGDQAPPAVRAAYLAAFADVAAQHAGSISTRPSYSEGETGPAWFAVEVARVPEWAKQFRGEIAHVHAQADASAHVLLCPRDAREVLLKGWGERHALSGSMYPVGYVMVYAPRTIAEIDTVLAILEAGVKGVLENMGELQ